MLRNRVSLGIVAVLCCACVVSLPSTAAATTDGEVVEMLVGSWKAEKEKTKKLLKEMKVTDEEIEDLLEEVGGFTLVIGKDKSFAIKTPEGDELKGTWELKSEDKEKKEAVLSMKLFDEPMAMTFSVMDMGQHVKVQPEGEQPAVFKKEKEQEKKDDK